MRDMDTKELLQDVSRKLSVLIALDLEKNGRKILVKDSVKMLVRYGISDNDIAIILGTSKATVQVLKSRLNVTNK